VRLELIDESFKKVLGELEELDFEEIEKFYDILVILKSSVRSEISKCASQLLSHSTFADGITPGVFGPQQRQPRHRAASTIMPEGRSVGYYSLIGNFGWQLRNCFRFAAK